MAKSATFGGIHLVIAFAVCYALTGDLLAASLYTLIEPAANTVAHKHFDDWWARSGCRSVPLKAALFGALHVVIAVGVGYALTGNLLAATAQTVVEPLCNVVALVCFDRWWDSDKGRGLRAVLSARTRAAFAS